MSHVTRRIRTARRNAAQPIVLFPDPTGLDANYIRRWLAHDLGRTVSVIMRRA